MTTLTKADLAESLSNKIGINKRETKEFVELFFKVIRETLEQGEAVKLSSFGNFVTRSKSARPGRNPKTGELVEITARTVVTFQAGQKLKARIEQGNDQEVSDEDQTES